MRALYTARMDPTSVALVLSSAAIHVGWNLLVKSSRDPRAFSAVKGLPFIALTIAAAFWFPLGALPATVWACVVASGVVHAVYVIGLSSAYLEGDLSLVYPITRSSPAFVPLAAMVLLGEHVGLQAGVGIAIVVASIALLHATSAEAGEDLRTLFTAKGLARNRYAFLTLASVVAYSLIDKAGMDAFAASGLGAGITRAFVFFLLVNAISFALYWTWMASRGLPGVADALRDEWRPALLAAAGTLASYTLILYVFQTERVSYVTTLRQSSVLIAVAVGWMSLGERGGRARLFAAALLLFGLALVALAR